MSDRERALDLEAIELQMEKATGHDRAFLRRCIAEVRRLMEELRKSDHEWGEEIKGHYRTKAERAGFEMEFAKQINFHRDDCVKFEAEVRRLRALADTRLETAEWNRKMAAAANVELVQMKAERAQLRAALESREKVLEAASRVVVVNKTALQHGRASQALIELEKAVRAAFALAPPSAPSSAREPGGEN